MVDEITDIQNICMDSNDAYSEVCSKLIRLCPRLVPEPLWGLNLAGVARMAPQAGIAMCNSCPETVEEVHRFWMSLDRIGKCEICSNPGNEIDENWLYLIFNKEGKLVSNILARRLRLKEFKQYKGIAYLKELRLLCVECHLAKHQGYAQVCEREQEALEHLAKVNQLSLEEAKKLVDKAFFIYRRLSEIRDWVIKIGELKGLEDELRRKVEKLLNMMYRKGFYLSGGWLYYQYPKYHEEVKPRIIHETMIILAEASKKAGTTTVRDDKWIDSLLEVVKGELESQGIRVLNHEFKLFIKYLLENEEQKRLLQSVVNYIVKGKVDRHVGIISLLLQDYVDLTGKWMVFVPTSLYPRIFRYIIDALEKAKLAYSAKITSQREDYGLRDELPIIIYVPISFATRYIVEVAEVLKRVLDEFYVSKKLFFKPDIFTAKGVYSGRVNHKPYIYVY